MEDNFMSRPITHGSSALAIMPQEPLSFDPTFLKEQEARNYCRDNATKSFVNPAVMLEFLEERENNADWISGEDTRALKVMLLEDSFAVYHALPQEIVHDTAKNTGLVIEGDNLQQMALRSCAISSLQDRARISGAALTKVSKPVLRNILNDCLDVASDKATVRIRVADGKVSAVLSSEYVPLSMPTIFDAAVEYINQRFPSNHFAGGSWSHILTTAEFELSGESELIRAYTEALEKHGIEHDKVQPGLRISSSDIGVSGVNLMPKLVVGQDRLLLPLGGPVGLEHKGDASMERFMENLDGIFAQYGDRLEKLSHLLDVEIVFPEGCMKGIMKRLGIPKKYAAPTLEAFVRGFSDGDSCTAHDIYYGLGDLLFQLQIHNASGEQILRMEESIAKALSLNFSDYDAPVDMS